MSVHPWSWGGLGGLVGLVLLCAGSAGAQYTPYPRPYSSGYPILPGPRLSPYLNLLRGGDPAANYYLGVVPERERRILFGSAIQDLAQRPAAAPPDSPDLVPPLAETGHATYFNNTSTYFNTSGRTYVPPARAPARPPMK